MLKFGALKAVLRLLWRDMTLAKALIIKRVQHLSSEGLQHDLSTACQRSWPSTAGGSQGAWSHLSGSEEMMNKNKETLGSLFLFLLSVSSRSAVSHPQTNLRNTIHQVPCPASQIVLKKNGVCYWKIPDFKSQDTWPTGPCMFIPMKWCILNYENQLCHYAVKILLPSL